MKKHLLTSALLVLTCCALQAQTKFDAEALPTKGTTTSSNKVNLRKGKGTKTFMYSNSPEYIYGTSKVEVYDLAVYIPGDYAGMTVDDIAFVLYNKNYVKNVSAWVSKTLPDTCTAADQCVALTTTQLKDYYNDGAYTVVSLANPYTIPAEGCYIGYSLTPKSVTTNYGKKPILFDGEVQTQGGFYWKVSKTDDMTTWGDYSENGVLLMAADLTGTYPDDQVKVVSTFPNVYGVRNSTGNATVTLENEGTNKLTSISYKVIDAAGNTSEERTATVDSPIEFANTGTVSIPLNTAAVTGSNTQSVVVTKANGVVNTESQNTATGSVVTLSQLAHRNVLEEEFTGTGCGFCPRGITGMDMCKEQISDRWIGVALHLYNSSDPMYPTSYAETSPYYEQTSSITTVGSYFSGAPSCMINRVEAPDPFYGNAESGPGIIDDCSRLAAIAPAGKISVKATWADENQTSINIESQSQFYYNADKSEFAVAYYVMADSLYGSTWKQSNYYATYTASQLDSELAEWAIGGEHRGTISGGYYYVSGLYFNHVALAGIGVDTGIAGSVASPIVEDAIQSHTTTVDLSGNKFFANATYKPCMNKKNVKVIAFIINTTSGEIVNAEECDVVAETPDGIETVQSAEAAVRNEAVYSVNGTRLSAPSKGINIIRLSNGKTVKVMMK